MSEVKIYLAGHSGLVGSAIKRKLTRQGAKNIVTRTSSELDLRCQADVNAFFEAERPEVVYLAAAKVGGILANSTYTAEFIYDNMMIAANVIEASYRFGVKKLLNLGSSCIYPKLAPQPMKEEYLLSGSLEPTNEPYAVAKIAAIKLCRYYNEQYGTNFISAMPTNLYGPGDNYNLETSHVLPALMRKFHLARLLSEGRYDLIREDFLHFGEDAPEDDKGVDEKLAGIGVTADAVTVWGTGEPLREFLYVDDLADACLFLMEGYDFADIGEFVNVGSGEDAKIKEFARKVKATVGFEGEIVQDSTKPDGIQRKFLDISRIKALGWKPKVGIEEGLNSTYEVYKSLMGPGGNE